MKAGFEFVPHRLKVRGRRGQKVEEGRGHVEEAVEVHAPVVWRGAGCAKGSWA